MRLCGNRKLRIVWKVFLSVSVLLILCFLYFLTKIQLYQPEVSLPLADVGIVLGAAMWDNTPSPGLKERLEHALELYQDGLFANLIVSGGLGGLRSTLSEAQGMKEYLMRNGVPEAHIFIEDQSHNTYENLLFSQEIMKRFNWEHAIIITHHFHGARARDIAAFIGLKPTNLATIPSKVLAVQWYKTRETIAFMKWELTKLFISYQKTVSANYYKMPNAD